MIKYRKVITVLLSFVSIGAFGLTVPADQVILTYEGKQIPPKLEDKMYTYTVSDTKIFLSPSVSQNRLVEVDYKSGHKIYKQTIEGFTYKNGCYHSFLAKYSEPLNLTFIKNADGKIVPKTGESIIQYMVTGLNTLDLNNPRANISTC